MFKSLLRLLLPAFVAVLPAAASAKAQPQRPALWVVKDADTRIYLFGTIHVLKPGTPWFDRAVKKAFDSSDTLVTEIVLGDPAAAQAKLLQHGLDMSGPTLTEKLPEARRAAYVQTLTRIGASPATFDRMKPWLAATQITLMSAVNAGYDPNSGPEHVLTDAATAAHKPITGLETIDQQFGYLDGLSPTAQLSLLTSTVDEAQSIVKELDAMVAAWSTAKTETLARIMNEDEGATPELMKTLIADRDARWAEWIRKRLAQPGTVFLAVGAGHLAGPDSVQAYLAKRHIKVRRVQ